MSKVSERLTIVLELYATSKGSNNYEKVLDDDLKMLVYDSYCAGRNDLLEELALTTKRKGLFRKLFKRNK